MLILEAVFLAQIDLRRDGRVVEGARLERVYRLIAYREFESLSLRHEIGGNHGHYQFENPG